MSTEPQVTRFRILVLDSSDSYARPVPRVEGVQLVVLDQLDLIPGSVDREAVYDTDPRPELVDRIRDLTKSGNVDYVVIGNNCGAGIELAKTVDRCLRAERSCVVWNVCLPGDEEPYAALGYRHFLSRFHLPVHLNLILRRDFGAREYPGPLTHEDEIWLRLLSGWHQRLLECHRIVRQRFP